MLNLLSDAPATWLDATQLIQGLSVSILLLLLDIALSPCVRSSCYRLPCVCATSSLPAPLSYTRANRSAPVRVTDA
jgi:hypothetical protein